MESLIAFLTTLNSLTPLAVIALLGTIIFLLVAKKGPIQTIKDNHLHAVTESLDKIVQNGDKQLESLNEIKEDIAWVRGKLS